MAKVIFKKSALKALRKMPAGVRERMLQALDEIAEDPSAGHGDWKRLKGSPYWRLRVGSWRAICALGQDEIVLLVLKVGVRGDVYK